MTARGAEPTDYLHYWHPSRATNSVDYGPGAKTATTVGSGVSTNADGWGFLPTGANTGYIRLTGPITNTANYSFSFWAKPNKTGMDATASGGWVICDRNGSTGDDWQFTYSKTTGKWGVGYWNTGGTLAGYSGNTPGHDVWTHVVVTVTGTKVAIYADGVAVTNIASHGTPRDAYTGNATIGNGSWSQSSDLQYRGYLDNLKCYQRALTPTEAILLNYLGRVYGSAPNTTPVADAGPDQIVQDFDGSGAENATLDGSASVSLGTIASWIWTTNGTQIASGTNKTVSLPVGVHTVQLAVTGSDGSNDTDTVQITVLPQPREWFVATNGVDNTDAGRGQSWALPFATISNAVAYATTANDIVTVSNGLYQIDAEIVVTNAITVRSLSGDPATTIVKRRASGSNLPRHRIFNISNANARVNDLTATNGYAEVRGAGVYLYAGTVSNCVVAGNVGGAYNDAYGGGLYMETADALLVDSTIENNSANQRYR